ncbi:MAG TPA: PAS domain S-box protein, partial [Isosphaeraceae bacterium]|nr:PAS domain S-box protein [Isosphaeraceae bacterium]
LSRLVKLKTAKIEELRQTIDLRDVGDLEAALQIVRTNYGKRVMDQARQLVLGMAEEEDRLLVERTKWSETAIQRAHTAFSIATGLALGLLGVVYFLKKQEDREQEQAAEALGRSEAWFHTTLRSLGEGVIATDERGQVQFLNPVAENLTGWTSEEAKDLPLNAIYRVVDEQTHQEMESPVSRVLREGDVVSLAQRRLLVARDGSQCPIEDTAAPIRDRLGKIHGAVLVVHDARQRRQAEIDLRRSEEQLRLIVESAQDYAIFTLDLDARVTSWNSGARRIIGYEPDEILGANGRIFFIPEDIERGIPEIEMQKADSQGRSENERWHVRKDGSLFWASGMMMPMREGGQLVGWLKIMRDTTEQKRTEQELELSRERLNLVVSSSEVGL